jgi:hypothetical protein
MQDVRLAHARPVIFDVVVVEPSAIRRALGDVVVVEHVGLRRAVGAA